MTITMVIWDDDDDMALMQEIWGSSLTKAKGSGQQSESAEQDGAEATATLSSGQARDSEYLALVATHQEECRLLLLRPPQQ